MANDAPHRKGRRFIYPGDESQPGLLDVLRWRMTSKAVPWPLIPSRAQASLPPAPRDEGVSATWVGQSTFVLRVHGATIITDPVFSGRASPVQWLGPRRAVAPGVAFEDLPRVDFVLLSHDHYDHCDLPTLSRLSRRDDAVVVAPLGHRRLLASSGIKRVVELDWWEEHSPNPGVNFTLVPARHWCRRMPFRTNVRLWGGFYAHIGGRTVYFAGDSGYDERLFKEIGRRMGAPDLALIPIGAYEPRWFMADAHMNPAEAVAVHRDVGSRRSVGMHWGTFQLTDEGYLDPVRDLERAKSQGEAFGTLPIGGSINV